MYLDYLVPSWLQIESRITDQMGYQGGAHFRTYLNEPVASLALNLRRVRAVQAAFNQAEWQAGSMLRQRFAELEIASIVDELLKVVREMAMIVVGSTLTGGAIGAGIGAFGAGAGAIPLAGAGAAMGLKVSGWILGVLGLASIAEFFLKACRASVSTMSTAYVSLGKEHGTKVSTRLDRTIRTPFPELPIISL